MHPDDVRDGIDDTDGHEPLPPYLPHDHDAQLRQALQRAIDGGPAVFAMVVGDSATGKTRALYEALTAIVPGWPLVRPYRADELVERLRGGQISSGTVLWLDEAQRFFYGDAGAVAAGELQRLLSRTSGLVAVGSTWQRPYLDELAAQGSSPDGHTAVRSLLTGPLVHLIRVPDRLSQEEQEQLLRLAYRGDRTDAARVVRAVAAGATDGRVLQHLSGGPELVDAYANRVFAPTEQAIITAALDARHLGHRAPAVDRSRCAGRPSSRTWPTSRDRLCTAGCTGCRPACTAGPSWPVTPTPPTSSWSS
ncbi:hypothetical protein [Streptomyces sp. NBC_01443]|uniref:hypothetical protein n=1 Tax=Streptomyces sp. NBC_01443 TaxID=2903868 RepID=UPI0022527BFB|nr:hypothetical protein [Streptomyces sp. NBC_01443]MCX4632317.1 ATP-binding protein [Streptomyces sp. NBC_01443]